MFDMTKCGIGGMLICLNGGLVQVTAIDTHNALYPYKGQFVPGAMGIISPTFSWTSGGRFNLDRPCSADIVGFACTEEWNI